MLCFLRLGRGEVLTLNLFRRFVNARISRSRIFLVERLPTLRAPALLARGMLDNFDGTLDAEQPRCGLYDVAQATWAAAVVLAHLTDADARVRPVERKRER
jgi:hypothetical protein